MSSSGIYDEIDSWQREDVLWACFIYVSEVDTESPLAIGFLDEYNIGQPLGIFYFSYCSRLEEFADFVVDGFLSLLREAPAFLFNRFEGRVGVQFMGDYCRVDSSHVCLRPCENVSILPQKLSEEAFEVLW